MRITKRNLELVTDRINDLTASPKIMFLGNEHNVGHYFIYYGNGGAQLCRVRSKAGTISDVLRSGSIPKRDLYNRMQAFVTGLEVYHG